MLDLQICIDACQRCHDTCLRELTRHCLEAGGPHVEKQHVILMLDCVAICQTSADFMLRDSPVHAAVCRACAVVCDACADSCDAVPGMEACARTCRDCARSCREMAGG